MKLRFKLFIFTLLSVLVLASATTFAVTDATPPANAEIGNQATLEYVTGSNEHRTVISNVVITVINPIYGVDIDPPIFETAKKGETVYYVHTVTNIGNTDDTYSFSVSGLESNANYDTLSAAKFAMYIYKGNALAPLTTITLKPGFSQNIVVAVKSSNSALADTPLGEFTVKAQSTTVAEVYDNVKDNLILSADAIVSAYKGFNTGYTGATIGEDVTGGGTEEPFLVTFYFQNTGGTSSGDVTLIDDLDDRFEIQPGSQVAISRGGADFVAFNYGETQDYVTVNKAKNGTKDQVTINIDKGSDGGDPATYSGLPVGGAINTLTAAQLKVSFWIQAKAGTEAGTIPNDATWTYDKTPADADENHNSGGKTNEVTYLIDQIAGVVFEGEDIGEVEQGSLIVFRNLIENTGNGEDTFDISYVENEFPSGSKFYLSHYIGDIDDVEAGEFETYPEVTLDNFDQRTPLIDSNNDTNDYVDTGIMQPGEKQMILLWVQLPLEATGIDIKLDKLGVSEYDQEVSDKARDICDIMDVEVDITNNRYLGEGSDAGIGKGRGPEAAPITEVSVNPGDTGYLNLYINNTAELLADEYTLQVSTDPTFETIVLPEGLDIKLLSAGGAEVTSTDVIPAGGHENIRAKVTVALGTIAGDHYVYFRARSSQTGAWDIKTDMVKIGTVRNLTIVPQNEGTIYAGDSIVYSHTIRNAGNVVEGGGATSSKGIIKMTNSRSNHFSSTCYWDMDENGVLEKGIDPQLADLSMEGIEGLDPGEEIDIFVEVQAANTATVDMQNTTKVRLDVNKGVYKIYHPDVFTYDITTIIEDELVIEKWQGHAAPDADGPDNSADFTKEKQWANPGEYVYYKVVATNTGTTTINSVHIEDLVPQYTSMVYSPNSAILKNVTSEETGEIGVAGWRYGHEQLTQMKEADTYPDPGDDGLIEAIVPALGPGESAELYFAVKINGELGNVLPDDWDTKDVGPTLPDGQ